MALTDHVAILLGHSFDVARLNKKKTRADFYAQFALPPAAAAEIAALVAAIYPGVPLSTLEVNFTTNAQQAKPFPGVPSDWFIVRMASQFAPELYAADGVTRVDNAQARSAFFAGMRVRVHSSAWGWKNEFGKSGASFNLLGVMDAGQGGERLSIGNAANGAGSAFATHASPNAQPSVHATPTVNPFAAAGAPAASSAAAVVGTVPNAMGTAPAVGVNPFAAATAASVNPFAQAAPAALNPFATA